MEAKRTVRQRVRRVRAARPAGELARADEGLRRHGLSAVPAGARIAGYAAVRDEPPTHALLDALAADGHLVLLPIVRGESLVWAPYSSWPELRPAARGLLEPATPELGGDLRALADLVLVPTLAVDRVGHRIGRGAGYFDRALVGMPTESLWAVVFTDEVFDECPVEAHDIPVGAALTPDGLLRLGNGVR